MSDGKNVSIEDKKFGTQLDYVPIMLSNGNLRLEFRIRVSELDLQRSVESDEMNVPGLRVRELDTGLELTPGPGRAELTRIAQCGAARCFPHPG